MNEQEIISKLKEEGFVDVYVQDDPAGLEYPEHTHEKPGVHVILEGEMTLTEPSGGKTIKAGDRLEIPAGTKHSAKMGPSGCKYIVGEK